MFDEISLLIGIAGFVFAIAAYIFRIKPEEIKTYVRSEIQEMLSDNATLNEIRNNLKEITTLLRETRENYVTKEQCDKYRESVSRNFACIHTKLDARENKN